MINSDHEVADLARCLEVDFQIDMNTRDMFSDELNNYFNYSYDEGYDSITYYFELDEGSCRITVHEPFSQGQYYEFNENLEKALYNIWSK